MSDVDTPSRDLTLLAPKFRAAVLAAISDCGTNDFPVKVNEAFRSQARQAFLFAQGRTRPGPIVTHAPTSLTSWHGYGLAVDIIHQTRAFEPFGKDGRANERWFHEVGAIFKRNGCSWGGDWTKPDTPHMQWGKCMASPTDGARLLIRSGGAEAVWRQVEAI